MAKRSSTSARFTITPKAMAELGKIVGHEFGDISLVREALTHSSAKSEDNPSNERLEFFGDAVLGLAVTEMLYHDFPEFPEGELTRIRSVLVSRETLAIKAVEYDFQQFVIIGKGVGSRQHLPRSILANIFEAIIAAMYFDGGYASCARFLRKCFRGDLNSLIAQQATRNYKSALQQLAQTHLGATPTYKLVSEYGPDHDKRFDVAALIGEREFDAAAGLSKKEAEQGAALLALKTLLNELDLGDKDAGLMIELDDDDDGDDDF